jgi:predicted amidophosphoribosyltransferase
VDAAGRRALVERMRRRRARAAACPPLSARRYNQSAELARAIALESGLAFEPGALIRVKPTRQQVGLTATRRQVNVRGAFPVPEQREIAVAGRSVLLVDDVYTTGATIRRRRRCCCGPARRMLTC